MIKRLIFVCITLIIFFMKSYCFAAPAETINGAYIGMDKEELLRLPDYSYATRAEYKEDGYYYAYEVIGGTNVGYRGGKDDFVVLDKGTCFVYFRDNKVVSIRLTVLGGLGTREECLKRLDSSNLPCDANWEDYKNSKVVKEFSDGMFSTWLKLHDDTFMTFTSSWGRNLDDKQGVITGLTLSVDAPFKNLEEPKQENDKKSKDKVKKKKTPIEKKVVDGARKILGF